MSLDLYIESNTPVLHRGTGVYIRENGETRELKTKQEVLTHFPDAKEEDIEEKTYEDNTYFHINLTHNLTEMASQCIIRGHYITQQGKEHINLYDLMWHPEGNLGLKVPTMNYLRDIIDCYEKLLENPNFFKKYNPDNGWGTYEQLLNGIKKYIAALHSISTEFENYTIVANT